MDNYYVISTLVNGTGSGFWTVRYVGYYSLCVLSCCGKRQVSCSSVIIMVNTNIACFYAIIHVWLRFYYS